MIDAVFISDLHLHPEEDVITQRFVAFTKWASTHTRAVYILGDFFHAWPGDDALDPWSEHIAQQLAWLAALGVDLYYMHGNRDFLLGPRFAQLAGFQILKEPTIITLGDERVLLAHGDRYCTRDKAHQRLRRFTRNRVFSRLFLSLPYRFRARVVDEVRQHSRSNSARSIANMNVVAPALIRHMDQHKVRILVHGHTHKPGHTTHSFQGRSYQQYVLSDWDDNPLIMCYDETNRFYFVPFIGE